MRGRRAREGSAAGVPLSSSVMQSFVRRTLSSSLLSTNVSSVLALFVMMISVIYSASSSAGRRSRPAASNRRVCGSAQSQQRHAAVSPGRQWPSHCWLWTWHACRHLQCLQRAFPCPREPPLRGMQHACMHACPTSASVSTTRLLPMSLLVSSVVYEARPSHALVQERPNSANRLDRARSAMGREYQRRHKGGERLSRLLAGRLAVDRFVALSWMRPASCLWGVWGRWMAPHAAGSPAPSAANHYMVCAHGECQGCAVGPWQPVYRSVRGYGLIGARVSPPREEGGGKGVTI